ncbi:hypothetical protein SOVF_089310 [Spinacia oleracea]|uniref:Non-specific lipid transfer protein GPI-anchored 1 n=1 Tax=Spinacia oleracea TaxID=3562 RepID=A0A9R0IVT5_SPIOL|nr:non-specific lipid transfer protein GPI-anchored 1 [Spinacia oleracea]KNA16415.1 hypothetical protein SOVF_089310 [Spinacia oleracea]
MMMNKLKLLLTITTALCILHGSVTTTAAPPPSSSLATECSTAVQQLISCLNFAKGGAAVPGKECCTSVTSMKEKQPVCLCFFIGQAHNGSEQIKSLGIQEDKLLQLPSACHLTNASASNCPKLLGISPTSPAASIFMANATTSSPGTPSSSSSSSTSTVGGSKSSGNKLGNGVFTGFMAVFVSAILCVLPVVASFL